MNCKLNYFCSKSYFQLCGPVGCGTTVAAYVAHAKTSVLVTDLMQVDTPASPCALFAVILQS